MSRKSPSVSNYDIHDKDPSQDLKFIDYLQKEENDKDYIERVLNLSASIENGKMSRIDTLEQLKKIVQHCLNASGKLFVKGKHPKALELLESTRNILGQVKNKDASLEKLKTVLYNNISACCLSIEDTSLAIRFIQSCLKKDSGLDINLTCVFYNNLTGIYLASKQIEKAFACAKKSLHLLEPQIFSMIKGTSSQILKQDPGFLKCLTVLLIGYLNMGHVLEAHRLIPGVSREVLEMSPKDFYKNAYGLSRKFLGEHHSLTERLSYCATKNEFILFKEVLTDSSEPERNQENQDSRRKLKNMLESVDDEDPALLMRKSPNPLSNPQSPKQFQIKKNFMKSPVKPQRIYGPPGISASNSGLQTDDELQGYYIPKKGGHHNRYHSDAYLQPEHSSDYMQHLHPRPPSSMGYGWEMQPREARPASPDTTQIFLQLMLNQQRDLEAKINDKFKEISSISQIKQNNRNEIRIFDLKDDVKLKILQKEIEALKAQVANLKQGKDLEPIDNRSANRINTDNTSHGFLPDEVNLIKITSEPGPTPEERKETDNLKIPDTDVSNNFLNPHHVLPVGVGSVKSDKSSFDHDNNITLPNFDASPISKTEQPIKEVKNNVKAPEWFPPPKEEPKKRTFKLDLNKVDPLQFPKDKNIMPDPDKKVAPASGNQLQTLQKDTKEISTEKNLSAKTPITFSDKVSFQAAVEDTNIRVEKPVEDPKKGTTTIANKMEVRSPKNAGKIEFPAPSKPVNKVEEVPVKQTTKPAEDRLVRDNTSDKLKAKKISFSIPNVIDYLDLSASEDSKMIPKYAVIKKRVFLDEDTQYMLSCTAIWTKQEKNFKWQLFGADNAAKPEFNKVHADLELAYTDLQQILKLIEFKDVMPATFHIKQITSFYNLVKYFLMPFTTVKTSENGRKEIAIYPKPPNLLTNSTNDMPTVEFMGRQCVMIFTHVVRNVFRIVLTDPETVGAEEAFRIDVEFDKPSFDQCFQKYGGGDPSLLSAETLVKIIQGYDEDADDDEIMDYKDIMKKLTNPERKDEEEIESFKVINKDLVDDLLNSLRELENVFSSYGINDFNQLLDKKDIKYCRLKTNGSIKKTALNLVWDRPQKQILEIKIRNFWETFAPTKKIKAQGTFNYLYDSVWKHFGLNYTQIEHSDKLAICSLVSEVFYIDFFEKELKKEEYDRYEENPISFVPIEVGTYSRIFLGETNKVPLTLSLIGIRGEPKGIKATSYNLEEVYEVGTFLHINPALWAKKEEQKKKKKSERVATITLVENYRLEFVLKKCGWEMLRNWLILDRKPSRGAIANNSFLKELGFMEQLENIVEANGVAKYFIEREDTQS